VRQLSYGASAKYCAFYPGSVLEALKDEVKRVRHHQGHIRLHRTKPCRVPWCGSW
jgi:hypothetical protein